jgi:hypothetical protein
MNDDLLLHFAHYGLLTPRPQRDIWSQLTVYESAELVKKILLKRFGKRPVEHRPLEVAAYVSQGRQYFEAAQRSEPLIKPLVLYYGVLSLSRAVILCSEVGLRHDALVSRHGVTTERWGSMLGDDVRSLPQVPLRPTMGTFLQLADATGNTERSLIYLFYRERFRLTQQGSKSDDIRGTEFKFQDVLSRLPDLTDLYTIAFSEPSKAHATFVLLHPELQTDYYVLRSSNSEPSTAGIRAAFGLHPDINIRCEDQYHHIGALQGLYFNINRDLSPQAMRDYVLPIKNDMQNIPYVVEPLSGKVILSTLSLLFLASYTLGNMVRYFPLRWADLVSRGIGDSILPLLRATESLIENRFPELVLQEMEALLTVERPTNAQLDRSE